MGNDKLSIFSFNSSRKGICSLPHTARRPYIETILQTAEPDICFFPGDDKTVQMNAVFGYEQFLVPSADGTVFLYNTNRVEMKKTKVNINGFGQLPGLDMDQMVCPHVEISTLKPAQSVVKQFSMVSWKYTMFTETKVHDLNTLVESVIIFAQRLAWATQIPVMIGGEMTIDYGHLQQIVKKLCREGQEMFLSDIQPEMSQLGYLPSMTKASLRDQRHLFMMDVFKCKPSTNNGLTQTLSSGPVVADCFIASKTLELTEAKLVDVEQMTGREIKVQTLKAHRPTETSMTIPARPPRHHGG